MPESDVPSIVDEMEAIDNGSRYWLFRAKEAASGNVELKEILDERREYDRQRLAERRPQRPGSEPMAGSEEHLREAEGNGGA